MASQPFVELDLESIENRIAAAISARSTDGLRLLGHGEVSIVLAWPGHAPTVAVKRVPPFRSVASAERYIEVCNEFFALLADAGVGAWPTELRVLERDDGRSVVYHCQPIADAAQLGTNVLRSTEPRDGHELLIAIADAAQAVCSPTVGLDCQLSNWLWDGSTAIQLDFTSPFMMSRSGTDLTYDSDAFLQEYPVVLRRYLKRELLGLIERFTTTEGALGDVVANLLKEGLDDWVDPAIRTFNDHLGLDLRRDEAERILAADARLLPLILRVKKSHRWWLTRTGRHYEQLLPERTTYGR